jgi:uncharacterized protein YbjT (DUF2867 family)
MKITLTGSLGHIGRPLTGILVQQGHQVSVISSKADRKAEIEQLGAHAIIGSITDPDLLTAAFTGADAVYTMIPPMGYNDPNLDLMALCAAVADNFANAIERSGVKRAIHLSSIGAHLAEGNGLIRLHYLMEQRLGQLSDVDITFMRPTGFYYNLFALAGMIKQYGFIATNYGGDDISLLVAPEDIATAIAEELAGTAEHRKVRYVASEELTCSETAAILGAAIGKPDLQWNIITNEQMLAGIKAAGMQPAIAEGYVEMYAAVHSGLLQEDYFRHRPTVLGKTKLTGFAKTFAAVYNQ